MLSKFDEYPIHQTPEPIAHPATSDRNFYDRTWFNGYTASGNTYFGVGLAVYPHRNIMDCAFSVAGKGRRQYCFFASRRAPAERTETEVGPFKIEVLEPMRRTRVSLAANESGLSCDLVFTALTAPIEEARQTLWDGVRRFMDATRYDLFGYWEGWIETPDGRIEVGAVRFLGTKDRSWGVRNIGEPQTGGAPNPPMTLCFVWSALFWADHVSHAILFDAADGTRLMSEGLTSPLYGSVDAVPPGPARVTRIATVKHRIQYHSGTRLAKHAEIDLVGHAGDVTTIVMEPLLTFHMKGLGYFHPEWGQGMWKGELALGHESFDPGELNLLAPENIHVQQVVRVTSGAREGVGVLEHGCFGPYAPSGFKAFLDGAG